MTAGQISRFDSGQRLRSKQEFDRVFKRPVRSSDALFTVLAAPSEGPGPRLGMAVSIRSAGNAVGRNRVKRLIRESFRLSQDAMPRADIVVMAKSGISARSNAEIRASLSAHWERIRKRCAQ